MKQIVTVLSAGALLALTSASATFADGTLVTKKMAIGDCQKLESALAKLSSAASSPLSFSEIQCKKEHSSTVGAWILRIASDIPTWGLLEWDREETSGVNTTPARSWYEFQEAMTFKGPESYDLGNPADCYSMAELLSHMGFSDGSSALAAHCENSVLKTDVIAGTSSPAPSAPNLLKLSIGQKAFVPSYYVAVGTVAAMFDGDKIEVQPIEEGGEGVTAQSVFFDRSKIFAEVPCSSNKICKGDTVYYNGDLGSVNLVFENDVAEVDIFQQGGRPIESQSNKYIHTSELQKQSK